MKFNKPNFWEKESLITYLLLPFSILVKLFTYLKKKNYKNFKV